LDRRQRVARAHVSRDVQDDRPPRIGGGGDLNPNVRAFDVNPDDLRDPVFRSHDEQLRIQGREPRLGGGRRIHSSLPCRRAGGHGRARVLLKVT
jgi:hypothetical protein